MFIRMRLDFWKRKLSERQKKILPPLHNNKVLFVLLFLEVGFPFSWTKDLAVAGHSDRHKRRGGPLDCWMCPQAF